MWKGVWNGLARELLGQLVRAGKLLASTSSCSGEGGAPTARHRPRYHPPAILTHARLRVNESFTSYDEYKNKVSMTNN